MHNNFLVHSALAHKIEFAWETAIDMDRKREQFRTSPCEEYEKLKQEFSKVEAERAKLQAEKEILLYNISVLFRTAKEEITRKDTLIANLRKSLEKYEKARLE
ncbi:hypothetical protein GAYE_SCF37G5128 [Galdieria yellowstonensis]|uniref:Uncharacterized protein n=1 Tax=Galdieria yellowstonensis TaxID=3028027 RepID=A0AAV9IJ09_9RHOD|nr:hypothetical protein GAYE_SCF37G5128 [Galdieria yellowstonensis]